MDNVFLTFDIEDWYHANYGSIKPDRSGVSRLEFEVDRLIEICSELGVKSTCFILGSVAEQNPNIVRKFYDNGHEIASHGYNHKLIYDMNQNEFREDVKKSTDILENIIGEKIVGFRAPSWSINKSISTWYYDTLMELNFTYSSSVYPAYTYLYGIPDAPNYPHIIESNGNKILEIPNRVTSIFGKKLGFTGGFYLRFFPTCFIKSRMTKNSNFFIYLHPREIDPNHTRMKLSFMENIIAYYGINSCEKKFIKIINSQRDRMVLRMGDYAKIFSEDKIELE